MNTTTTTHEQLHRAGYRLTYVEGLAVVARFTSAGVPVVLRVATGNDHTELCYQPTQRDAAAVRVCWERLASNGG